MSDLWIESESVFKFENNNKVRETITNYETCNFIGIVQLEERGNIFWGKRNSIKNSVFYITTVNFHMLKFKYNIEKYETILPFIMRLLL